MSFRAPEVRLSGSRMYRGTSRAPSGCRIEHPSDAGIAQGRKTRPPIAGLFIHTRFTVEGLKVISREASVM